MEKKSLGIYVHIPFCRSRCVYCDFVSSVGDRKSMDEYVRYLIRQIEIAGREYACDHTVDTVYFGGGTPSLLPDCMLEDVSRAIFDNFDVKAKEFSVEANPCTIDEKKLSSLISAGATRASIGLQTFDDKLLKTLGRAHDSHTARRAIELVLAAGLDASVDCMIGLPEQKIQDVKEFIDVADGLGVEHISVYMLSVEKGTRLERLIKEGVLIAKSDDELADFYDYACDLLKDKGYERYEVSNFCKDKKYSLHNLRYWQREDYLGLGLSAHSFVGRERWRNSENFSQYYRSIERNELQRLDLQRLDIDAEKSETVMLGLRLKDGVDIEKYNKRFDADFIKEYERAIEKNKNYLDFSDGKVAIKYEYLKVMNWIAADFLK